MPYFSHKVLTHMNKLFILSAILLLMVQNVNGQQEEEINVVEFRLLDYGRDNLPDSILMARSAVFVSVPPVSNNSSERGAWKLFSKEAHKYLMQIGIDPVAYFNMEDIFAGQDATSVYSDFLIRRDIKYIILLNLVDLKMKNKEVRRCVVAITEFNGQKDFISHGQKAWKDQGKELKNVMKNLLRVVVRKEYKKTNHLIIDQPEFFGGLNIVKKRRNESFPSDLRIDKLAVPKFTDIEIPANTPGGTLNNRIKQEILIANRSHERLNRELDRVFDKYPYKYELIDPARGEDQLYKDGFLFLLLNVQTTGFTIKEMLNYDLNLNETDYITVKNRPDGTVTLRTIPVHAPVYKFYIKQLYTKDIYIGETWDADETWQEALENYLDNLTKKLRR